MSKTSRRLTKLLAAYGVALALLFTFIAGVDATHRHWFQIGVDAVIVLFGLGFTLIMRAADLDEIRQEVAEEMAEEAKEKLDKIFEAAAEAMSKDLGKLLPPQEQDHKKQMTDTLMHIIDEVTGGNRPPKPTELATIAAKFHEATGDHFVRITLQAGGMQVEIKNEPFEAPKKRAPRKPRTPKLEQTELVPEKSKSQERREAAMKADKSE